MKSEIHIAFAWCNIPSNYSHIIKNFNDELQIGYYIKGTKAYYSHAYICIMYQRCIFNYKENYHKINVIYAITYSLFARMYNHNDSIYMLINEYFQYIYSTFIIIKKSTDHSFPLPTVPALFHHQKCNDAQ